MIPYADAPAWLVDYAAAVTVLFVGAAVAVCLQLRKIARQKDAVMDQAVEYGEREERAATELHHALADNDRLAAENTVIRGENAVLRAKVDELTEAREQAT